MRHSINWNCVVGVLVIVGGSIWYLLKKNNKVSFDAFRQECIDVGKILFAKDSNLENGVIVLIKKDTKVYPYIFKKYKDGRVTKQYLNTTPYPLDSCPDEIKEGIKNHEYVLFKF